MSDAEGWLRGLEPAGWRFGLERIRLLTSLLGMPQRRFASIHVVGTNGKSSVTALAAALLEAGGATTGAFVSPHAERWSERILIGGEEIPPEAFSRAAERVAESVPAVERGLEAGDVVTQFEAATATAFVAFAAAGVDVAVVEAGLGGRLDATNVIGSRVTALTSIGLEHTEYLGDSEAEIAAEKLAVLRDHSTLVVGAVSPEVAELARRSAAARGAELIDASAPSAVGGLAARAPYLARNLAVARAAAEVIAGPIGDAAVEEVAGAIALPGRMEVAEGEVPVLRDAAHNPEGARALAEALGGFAAGRRIVACIAVLAGKDAAAIVAELAAHLDAAVATEIPASRLQGSGRPAGGSVPAAELAALTGDAGVGEVEVVPDPRAAVARAIELARARGGVALVAGSHYLLGYGP